MKVRILAFSTTFTQLTSSIKNFLEDWLLSWGLKGGLVECAIVCVKSWVILKYIYPPDQVSVGYYLHTVVQLHPFMPTNKPSLGLFNGQVTKKWPSVSKVMRVKSFTFCHPFIQQIMPKRIYNPITAMGFLAMFTFYLDNTKR